MAERVVLREFSSRGEAEIVRELLLTEGIQAFVISDDCGSVDPGLAFGRGVQLLVAESDLADAIQVIAQAEASAAGNEDLT
jgi:hypothetical protein